MNNKINAIQYNIWFYDIEVYKDFWSATFINIKTKQTYTFQNNYDDVINFINNNNGLLGGYNNRYYDNYILKEILLKNNPYELSKQIIYNKLKPFIQWPNMEGNIPNFAHFDVMELVSNERYSLKKYKAFMGLEIEPFVVNYNYENELTNEQKQRIINNNIYNVNVTMFLFNKFIDEFLSKLYIIQEFKLNINNIHRSISDLSAIITQAKEIKKYEEYKYETPSSIKSIYETMFSNYLWIVKRFEEPTYYTQLSPNFNSEQIGFDVGFNEYLIACKGGGAHGSIKSYFSSQDEYIFHIDYVSNYSNIMQNFNFTSSAAPNMKQIIKDLTHQRNQSKNLGYETTAKYIKKYLVSMFGAMEYKYSKLWDPKMRLSVCLTGQLLIILLHIILAPYATFLQVNTDGIIIKIKDTNGHNLFENIVNVDKALKNWERLTNMPIDIKQYKKIFQKDENNYILIADNEQNWKVKGKFLKNYKIQFHKENYNQGSTYHNNSLTIIDEAIVNYLTKDIAIIDTLKACNDLVRFQYIIEIKGMFKFAIYDKKYIENVPVIRLFFTKSGSPILRGYKDTNNKIITEKIPYSSERCIIINENILNYSVNEIDIDYQYYEKIANDYLLNFKAKKYTPISLNSYPGYEYECSICHISLLQEKTIRHIHNKEVCKKCYINASID